ncbi:MAG: ABC transporter ATP-binding protein [Spirochaetales bacterium]|nr:ABC transporter ATP-binding protein [Spirochaetales bacterium]MBP5757709.1 ABC transporter ATP-binding protein [Spirochaetales bacterium]
MVKTLLKQIGEYKKQAILTPLLTSAEVFMEILIPFVTAKIIDKGINEGNLYNIFYYGAIMLILAFISLFFGIKAGQTSATAATGFASNLRKKMYRRIQAFSFSNIDHFSTAGLVTRMTTDVTSVENAFQMTMRIAVRAPLMLILSMVMCFMINVRLTLVFLAGLVFLGFCLFFIMHKVMPIFKRMFEKYDELNASIQENVTGIRAVKAFVREDFEKEKFGKAAYWIYSLSVKAEKILAFNGPVMMSVVYTSMMMLAWLGSHFIVAGTMTTGNLTSLFSYVASMLMSMMMTSMIFVMLSMSLASARRINEVLTEEPEIKNPENPVMEVYDGSIDFEDVQFSYRKGSGESTLRDINLHIKSGETIGIIGGTGSGKSTLVSLISRLYDTTSGKVKVGGIDVKDYDIEVLRNNVSVVLQKNEIFSGTIIDNLRWGNENATEEECKNACILACADEFIEQKPDKYYSWIEQGGTNVSGGQKQRLCIARALLKNPKILILDDSTSAVDTATDAKIRKAFRENIPHVTKLIISQRISSIQDADRILVLDDGKVNGFDTHDNLLKFNQIYKEICEVQMQSGGDFDEKMN